MAIHLVKIACELPDRLGVSLSQWDCVELAGKLMADGIVTSISPQTVERILNIDSYADDVIRRRSRAHLELVNRGFLSNPSDTPGPAR